LFEAAIVTTERRPQSFWQHMAHFFRFACWMFLLVVIGLIWWFRTRFGLWPKAPERVKRGRFPRNPTAKP
jgi:hypothetical protein